LARVSVKKPLKFEAEQELLDRLFSAFALLGNWQAAESFLMEFLTRQELTMLAKRLELYKRIMARQKYREIIHDLRVTSQTVSSAKKKLKRADAYFERIMRKFRLLDEKGK